MAYQPNLINDFVNRNNDGMLTNIGSGIAQVSTGIIDRVKASRNMDTYQGLLTTAIRPEDGMFNPKGWMDAINSAPESEKEKVIQMYNVAKAEEEQRLKDIAEGVAALNTDRWEAARIDINEDVFDPDAIDEFLAAGLELGIFDETEKMIDKMTAAEQSEQLTQNIGFLGPGYAGNVDGMVAAMETAATANENDGDFEEAAAIRERIADIYDGKLKEVIAEIQVTSSLLPGGDDVVKTMLEISEGGRADVELSLAKQAASIKAEKFEQDTQTWERGLTYAQNADTRAEKDTRLNALKYQLDEKKYDLDTESVALDARRVRVTENKYLSDVDKDAKYLVIDQQKQVISERLATVTEAQLKLQQEAGVRAQIATEINMTKAVMSSKFQTPEEKMAFAEDISGFGLETAELLGQLIGVKNETGEWSGNEQFQGEQGLRKEYDAYVSEYNTMISSVDNMEALFGGANPGEDFNVTGAADYSVIRLFNKALDPGSVVRQSEADATAGAQSFLNELNTKLKGIEEGDLLSPELRAEIMEAANILKLGAQQMKDKEVDRISFVANKYGFSKEAIFLDGEYDDWNKEDSN